MIDRLLLRWRSQKDGAMNQLSAEHPGILPEGTVTFLFTEIKGSTRLSQMLGEENMNLLADHHVILRSIFKKWHGQEVDTEGDALFVSCPKATEAVAAAAGSNLITACIAPKSHRRKRLQRVCRPCVRCPSCNDDRLWTDRKSSESRITGA